jgi:hypothetical protein
MAKYIKQEFPDLHNTGKTQAYYRMQIDYHLNYNQFIEQCVHHGGFERSTLIGAIAHVVHELALQMAMGRSVTIDGLGSFHALVGVRSDQAQDAFEEGEPSRNAVTLEVNGVSYKADRELVGTVNNYCVLERGGVSRLKKSKLTLEQRIAKVHEFLGKYSTMNVDDYASLTGLSVSSASRELRKLRSDPSTGITCNGRGSNIVYVLTRQDEQEKNSSLLS